MRAADVRGLMVGIMLLFVESDMACDEEEEPSSCVDITSSSLSFVCIGTSAGMSPTSNQDKE